MALSAEAQPPEDEPSSAAAPTPPPSFLRVLAHELRNHIATINNTVFMLRLQAGTATPGAAPAATPDATRGMLELIDRQAAAMMRVLDVMVEAERAERGELTLALDSIDVRTIVSEALAATAELRTTRGHALSVSGTAEPVEIRADARRLAGALTHVLDNAMRYSGEGGRISLDVSTTAEEVFIHLRDEGQGIAPERLPRIFDFMATREGGAGLGVGLPLASAWLNLHGGSIEVNSAGKNQGTHVQIRLPRAGRVPPVVAQEAASLTDVARPSASAHRVLVVDDHASLRSSLSSALQEMGHVTREAAGGGQALAAVEEWQPEFVLLDIHMPGMSGFEVARELRRRHPQSAMQLVMMSGDTLDEFVIAGAREAGFDHWIDKTQALEGLSSILGAGAAAL